MMNVITKIIAPLWYALTNGVMYSALSYRELRNTICRHYGAVLYGTEESTTNGVTTKYVRKEGTKTISPMRRMLDKLLYDKLDIDSMLAYVRHVYVWLHLPKQYHKIIGLTDAYIYGIFKRLNMPIPKRPNGQPKIMWVSENWYRRSALHKLIFTATSNGQQNIWIQWGYKIPYQNGETLSRSIQAFNDFRGTIWFNGKIAYTVFDIVEIKDIVHIYKESDIVTITGAKKCILSDLKKVKGTKKLVSNNGAYIQQWRLEKFYENNPDGTLWAVDEENGTCHLRLLLPEDKEYKREYGQYVGVYQEDQEILEADIEARIDTVGKIAREMYIAADIFQLEKLGWKCIEDAIPVVYQLHPWLTPVVEETE